MVTKTNSKKKQHKPRSPSPAQKTVLTQLPDDISMLGQYLKKNPDLSHKIEADYHKIIQQGSTSEDGFKIAVNQLYQYLDWKMDLRTASSIIETIEEKFKSQLKQPSYYEAIYKLSKACLYTKLYKMHSEAAMLAKTAAKFLEKTPYKAEFFKANTILAQIYFEADARKEAIEAIGKAQALLSTISSSEYLTNYYFISARINFEAGHFKACLENILQAQEFSKNTAFFTPYVTLLFEALKIEAMIEIGEKNTAHETLKALCDQYETLFVNYDNLYAARILNVKAKLLIAKYEIFSASEHAQKSVDLFEKEIIGQNTLYHVNALETACDAYALVGLEEKAKMLCEKMIETLNNFVLMPENSIRQQRAQAILESL